MMTENCNERGSRRRGAKPSKGRFDGNLRTALWSVYEGRCAYTYELLSEEAPEFSVRNECGETRAVVARPGMYLNCNLPGLPDMTGIVLVMFKRFKLRDAFSVNGRMVKCWYATV